MIDIKSRVIKFLELMRQVHYLMSVNIFDDMA